MVLFSRASADHRAGWVAFIIAGSISLTACSRYVPLTVTEDGAVPDSAPAVDQLIPPDAMRVDSAVSLPDTSPAVPGTWVSVSGAAFKMGSPASEPCRSLDESYHTVVLSHDFFISATEVTQAQYAALMGDDPAFFGSCGSDCPVEMVSWAQAAAYCNALSTEASLTACYVCNGSESATVCATAPPFAEGAIYSCPGFRLPTEAEWEHAYRAGTFSAYYAGAIGSCAGTDSTASLIAWYAANAADHTHPAAKKQANAWGLFDMAGNVREWCHDRYSADLGTANALDPWGAASGENRVVRGGGWGDEPAVLRASRRMHSPPATRSNMTGFRCVRSRL